VQRAVELEHRGMTLRGMEHIPTMEAGGTVPAVILFHGFTGTKLEPHRMFLKISRSLEQLGIASFRFDFLGSGESDGNFEDMTLSREVDEAHAMLDYVRRHPAINAQRVSVLGLSMGGLVASLLAGERPDEVHKLGLLAPASNMGDIVTMMLVSGQVKRDVTSFDHAGNLVGRAFAEDLQGLEVYKRASHYAGDVLLVHGADDVTVPPLTSHTYQAQSYGERGALHIIEGADHTFNKHTWETQVIDLVSQFFYA